MKETYSFYEIEFKFGHNDLREYRQTIYCASKTPEVAIAMCRKEMELRNDGYDYYRVTKVQTLGENAAIEGINKP